MQDKSKVSIALETKHLAFDRRKVMMQPVFSIVGVAIVKYVSVRVDLTLPNE